MTKGTLYVYLFRGYIHYPLLASGRYYHLLSLVARLRCLDMHTVGITRLGANTPPSAAPSL